jgi:addiction module HigA family antidote
MHKKLLPPIYPGEILPEEFLKPLDISQYRSAKEIGVPAQRLGDIVAGKRAITADTDLRLCRFFGLSEGYWLCGQARFDTETAKDVLTAELAKIKPWASSDAQTTA